ncbi:LRRNT 2 domain-containing protein [Citrus sinensis]|nr:receptor-like protein 12 [Citrus x clementina]XP_052287271.1 receptor-like protein 33 [Citrus sinensis]KAH9667332.1 LRRNT 2 domain-containing protein [Citrus sinensis]
MSGTIPTCLITNSSRTLNVLNLARNHLNGTLSDTVPGNCGLQILDINGNQLEGMFPKSLVNCNMLQVFNIGNNQISDKFPCWLKNASGLQVLVLRSNKFSGNISCPRNNVSWTQLQIVDLASNNFSGRLSQKWLLTLEDMMDAKPESGFELKHLRYATGSSRFYEVTLSLTIKGLEIMLQKIPNIFTSIDLSSNNFEEQIPEEMGRFVSLYALNLSHNALTGSIPSSFGNLKHIESLDLSTNNLSGKISAQLASLNFLSVLNLSYNNLVGKIPTSTQLQSFSPTSYEVNKGLYGPPLTNESQARPPELQPSPPPASSDEIDWFFIAMSIGFAVGFGAVISPL